MLLRNCNICNSGIPAFVSKGRFAILKSGHCLIICLLISAANTSNSRKSPQKNPDAGSVALEQVRTVLNGVYGTSKSLDADSDESFPLQQKVLVSAFLLLLKKGHNKDVTVGKVWNN